MKKIYLILALIAGLIGTTYAQDLSKDYVIVDRSAPDQSQLMAQYNGQPRVFLNDNAKPAPYVIAAMLETHPARDLHLYLSAKPGMLQFGSTDLDAENASGYADFFKEWKKYISGKVIIHSKNAFTTPAGIALENQLESLTGLEFITE
jgi:hypothetical protein